MRVMIERSVVHTTSWDIFAVKIRQLLQARVIPAAIEGSMDANGREVASCQCHQLKKKNSLLVPSLTAALASCKHASCKCVTTHDESPVTFSRNIILVWGEMLLARQDP